MGSRVKIVVFVPKTHAAAVRQAVGDAGAGRIGDYSHCSFSVEGTGRYLPLAGARPALGQVGRLAEVIEERIEFVCDRAAAKAAIAAMKRVHPYEEVAYDIYALLDEAEL